MQYPLISEYLAAIRDAHDNLDKLSHLVPVLDNYGEPYRSSGAFAVVFKMKDEQTGKCYALKCFTEEQDGRAEAYRQIAEELEFVNSPYITYVKYLEKELFVDSNCEDDEFPVLLMDWIEGETMETYIADHYMDNYAMSMLCYRFCKMAAWLRSQPFAHGDIKPDNIMVRSDGTLTLVDYDGMFVPAMKGQKSPTIHHSLTSINIPNSVTTIGKSAFFGCLSLTSINIPNSVTTIEDNVFFGCLSLTSINIPNSVTTIGEGAFDGCKSLTSINIPNSVTTIGKSAFFGCDSLTSINIPNSVTTIGKGAFFGCRNLPSHIESDIIQRFGEKVFECTLFDFK